MGCMTSLIPRPPQAFNRVFGFKAGFNPKTRLKAWGGLGTRLLHDLSHVLETNSELTLGVLVLSPLITFAFNGLHVMQAHSTGN